MLVLPFTLQMEHPITPPPELVEQWTTKYIETPCSFADLVNEVARWGADQRGAATEAELQEARDEELDACCEVLHLNDGAYLLPSQLRAARRPQPLTDKEQALADLASMFIEPCLINGIDVNASVRAKYDNIRRALKALPND